MELPTLPFSFSPFLSLSLSFFLRIFHGSLSLPPCLGQSVTGAGSLQAALRSREAYAVREMFGMGFAQRG